MAQLAQAEGAVEIHITGIVQGVGFRPHVYKLATSIGLNGWVINTTAGVTVRLEGSVAGIRRFIEELKSAPPPLARIENFTVSDVQPEGFSVFFIHESRAVPDTEISIPPDVGTCPDCLREYGNSTDRRYGYAFTNCVNCGPRFSITCSAPYDRKNTSMQGFAMCEKCTAEYTDPAERRFHAEPNACPVCGPQITLTSPDGMPLAGDIRTLLKEGRIVAIKGIGGYHLACDAQNDSAVSLLRERKHRQTKPFALMCRDLEVVRLHCNLSPEEEKLLTSPARPIVLLKRRPSSPLAPEIAPGLDTLGIMLPYTPLHYGLFDDDLPVLIMTSANIGGDPLIISEEEAYAELGPLADAFVVHKREIVNRTDDSVAMLFRGDGYFIRRARGYVPQGIKLSRPVAPILAAGGDLKSVFGYARREKAILSQYFGDLDNLKNLDAYEDGICFFGNFLQVMPEKVVCDLHPGYVSANYAERYAEALEVPLIKVQHHKAHFASVMADNGLDEKVLGVICDGTGYGDDGAIWGCEFFYGNYDDIERVGSLMPFPQPHGDGVVQYPLHMATVLLYALWRDEGRVLRALPEGGGLLPFAKAQAVSKTLSITSTSCGRLFDVAAALCGFTGKATYEGEAAMRMEALAHAVPDAVPYRHDIIEGDMLHLSWHFLSDMAEDKLRGTESQVLAARFHRTISEALCNAIEKLAGRYGTNRVVFSGGTFQNRFITHMLAKRLSAAGIVPYFHRQV
ncbi:MAG TPA: carbamoyltransferase HypF, partial [Anaerolineae bacterium]|nr:carbamoyltransferase HypF [Anaerolineae bacterium]